MSRFAPLRAPAALDDHTLVQRCMGGDRTAQRHLFDREKRRVYGTLYRILGPNPHLEDLLQDVFLSVFRSLATFRGEAALSTWIDRCTVRAAIAHMRSRRPRPLELVADNLASEDPGAERRALAREATRRLYTVLDGLEPKQRLAFTLYAVDGRSIPEVAELTEATVVATKARVWRARRYVDKRAKADPLLSDYLDAAARSTAGDEEVRP
jgi:RNA polymerase sigma-70 factor (ECF subfamily)